MRDEITGKRKIGLGTIIILIILLVILGIGVLYYLSDSSVLGECQKSSDCGPYNVFYIKGQGYVCANSIIATDNSIKTKMQMFKYASKKSVVDVPSDCSCAENQCEIVK